VAEQQPIEVGHVWRRKPNGYLYKVEEVAASAASNIRLTNLHDKRTSWISASGLRTKFELTEHGDTASAA
jgi:hypothetical protein